MSKKNKQIDLPIDWIFDPPNHGKGPCDGMAAVIKLSAKSYVRISMCLNFFHFFLYFIKNNKKKLLQSITTFTTTKSWLS